jgi:hypothetical protein
MSHGSILWIAGAVLSACCAMSAGVARASPTTRPAEVPRVGMSGNAYHLLQSELSGYSFHNEKDRADDQAALVKLRAVRWPDFSAIKSVRVEDPSSPNGWFYSWLVAEDGKGITILQPNLTPRYLARRDIGKISPVDFAEVAGAIEKRIQQDDMPQRLFAYTRFESGGMPFYGGAFLVSDAYVAASLGDEKDTHLLLSAALGQREDAMILAYQDFAWEPFFRGIEMLDAGESRADVLAVWKAAAADFPNSNYSDQLADYIAQLQQQVRDDQQLAAEPATDPATLPIDRRIAWYLRRFPDVHGVQFSQPGECMTVGFGEGTKISDATTAIGWPAMPMLIDHLTDLRLTRSIGYWRNFAPDRTVLRVQDVALACIESIAGAPFYRRSSTSAYLSNEKPEVRQAVIDDVRKWWKENGSKGLVPSLIARLDKGDVYQRMVVLEKIEKADPKAIDSVAVLKKWGQSEQGPALAYVAEALAQRKDFSLLPTIRRIVRQQPGEEDIWYLLRYGEISDYQFLRRQTLIDLGAGAQLGNAGSYFEAVAGEVNGDEPVRPMFGPIAVDFLSQRKETGSRYGSGMKQAMPFSLADSAMGSLIRLTGHDEGYRKDDAVVARYAAIDRWIAWWNAQGKNAFLAAHPDVKAMYDPPAEP